MKSCALILATMWVGLLPSFAGQADSKPMDDVEPLARAADSSKSASGFDRPSAQPFSGRPIVQAQTISAEIIPVPGKANAAASALQLLGFRILHIGTTVSVEGPETLWGTVFDVSFETRKKRVVSQIEGGDVTYRSANTEKMRIPAELASSIADVAFVEPPEFY